MTDLPATLQDLEHLGVGFVSLTEALDLATPLVAPSSNAKSCAREAARALLRHG